MKTKETGDPVRMELKYCERCGALWLRECGAGVVYCERCESRVAALPIAKKRPGRLVLPVGPKTRAEEYGRLIREEADLKAAGGVA